MGIKSTPPAALDRAIDDLSSRATAFARLAAGEKAALLRQCIGLLVATAPAWVADGCRAKGLDPRRASEEWLSGPVPVVRMARLLVSSLTAIHDRGKPSLGTGTFTGPEDRLAINLFPASAFDRTLFPGFSGYALMKDGIGIEAARHLQASFHGRLLPEGRVALVLGAGNVSSIPPMDVFSKMFVEGKVCLLKMSPVNEWLGPHLMRALDPLTSRGYLRIVYGGSDVGAHLATNDRIDEIHITGSHTTHDVIVWGPPGPGRTERLALDRPILEKPITSELGNVGPVAIVPSRYSDAELVFQARNLATMVTNNAAFNCNAAHVIITSSSWPQRARFFELVAQALRRIPPRVAYYPGARDRYEHLTRGQERVEYFGHPGEGELAWALIRDVDARDTGNPLFRTEPFCGLVSDVTLDSLDPVEFLDAATRFMNDVLWGTLNACLVIPRALERDTAVGAALDRAIVALRYGMVAVNHWPAFGYAVGTLPWGGHPSSTRSNIQSGLGWVHNTFMLDGVDKSVVRGPVRVRPAPAWFSDGRISTTLGPNLVRFESAPSWFKVPRLAAGALGW